ncbi:MAG: histone deacetylase, partial [Verrucomicrobia bacterium]|nr:histone deacetylase [Verrucomicrobiota bacterium]
YRDHETGRGHPESFERFDAVLSGIRDAVPTERLLEVPAREATLAELHLCHAQDYVQSVLEDVQMGRYTLRTGDTDICSRSFSVARRAVGGALNAVDAVMAGRVRNAFCALRPPGHHAEADRGMGFCIFNNAAIAARYALQHAGVDRVLIVDWDVHHGNGTQWIFYDDPTVFYFSTHQWPHYPGTGMRDDVGAAEGRGFTLNAPLAGGSARQEVLGAFKGKLVPAMRAFKPNFVIISAGFDCEAGDPLGGFGLQEEDFVDLTRIMLKLADDYADGRLISVLEGGYRLEGLHDLCGAHVLALQGTP